SSPTSSGGLSLISAWMRSRLAGRSRGRGRRPSSGDAHDAGHPRLGSPKRQGATQHVAEGASTLPRPMVAADRVLECRGRRVPVARRSDRREGDDGAEPAGPRPLQSHRGRARAGGAGPDEAPVTRAADPLAAPPQAVPSPSILELERGLLGAALLNPEA